MIHIITFHYVNKYSTIIMSNVLLRIPCDSHSPCVCLFGAKADAEAESLQHAVTNAKVQGPKIFFET